MLRHPRNTLRSAPSNHATQHQNAMRECRWKHQGAPAKGLACNNTKALLLGRNLLLLY